MFKREEDRSGRVGAAPSAFLHLSDEGAVELDGQQSPARRRSHFFWPASCCWQSRSSGRTRPRAATSRWQ